MSRCNLRQADIPVLLSPHFPAEESKFKSALQIIYARRSWWYLLWKWYYAIFSSTEKSPFIFVQIETLIWMHRSLVIREGVTQMQWVSGRSRQQTENAICHATTRGVIGVLDSINIGGNLQTVYTSSSWIMLPLLTYQVASTIMRYPTELHYLIEKGPALT